MDPEGNPFIEDNILSPPGKWEERFNLPRSTLVRALIIFSLFILALGLCGIFYIRHSSQGLLIAIGILSCIVFVIIIIIIWKIYSSKHIPTKKEPEINYEAYIDALTSMPEDTYKGAKEYASKGSAGIDYLYDSSKKYVNKGSKIAADVYGDAKNYISPEVNPSID